jgi:16S rRNA (guanine(966)-N(2))-methyltransferase RsmD
VRIIAGTVGGRSIRAPRGLATRPTADRVREALFNILASRGEAPEQALDLYAGSGALGLEALSRGAGRVTFVEQHAPTCELIRDNAEALGFSTRAVILCKRVIDFVRSHNNERFGWIFVDPPYESRELGKVLDWLDGLLAPGGLVIAEHSSHEEPDESHGGLALADRRRYGQTALSIYLERK